MSKEIKEFALIKAIRAVAYDLDTNEVLASTKNLKNMTVTDETGIEYLVGGENNAKLIPIVGEQDAKIAFNVATTSDDWLALQLNAETIKGSVDFDTEEVFTVGGDGTITIQNLKDVHSVYTTDDGADGRDDVKLERMTAESETPITTGKFAVVDGKLKVNTELANKDVHVFFSKTMADGKSMKSDGGQGKTVKLVVTGLAVDPSTQIPYLRNYVAYKAKVTQSVTQEAQNDGVPGDISFEFSCLRSNKHKCSYETFTVNREELEANSVL